MRTTKIGEASGLGAMAVACFGALVHCGGGSSGGSPSGEPGGLDAASTVGEVQKADGGPVGTTPDDDASAPRKACQSAASCTGSATMACCGGFCADTAKDPANCGQCGVACTANQFCTGTACDDATFANVCDNTTGTVGLDPYPEDNQAGGAMGTALTASCVPPTMILQTMQNARGVLEPVSNRPISGAGNTFITGGGSFGQNGVAYMEAFTTPLYLWSDGTTGQFRTRPGKAIVTTPVTGLTAHHDYFYVQLSVEPRSSTLCLSAVGMMAPGTGAAGYYASTELIPKRSKYTASWYVYEWLDTNNDSIANAGDMFSQVGAGP